MLMGRIFDIGANNPNYTVNFFTDAFDKKTDIVFLNTCGFLSSGRDEMMDMVLQLAKAGKKIYLIGCGLQYYKTMMPKSLAVMKFSKFKNLFFLSRTDFDRITLAQLITGFNSKTFTEFEFANSPRVYTNAAFGFEYLKIAE